jgi:hypothetical protein
MTLPTLPTQTDKRIQIWKVGLVNGRGAAIASVQVSGHQSGQTWWAHQDLNLEPTDYESAALTN